MRNNALEGLGPLHKPTNKDQWLILKSQLCCQTMIGGLPECVDFFDLVEGVLAKLDVMRRFPAALVLVGGDVCPESLQVAQAVSSNGDVGTLSFNQLKMNILYNCYLRGLVNHFKLFLTILLLILYPK